MQAALDALDRDVAAGTESCGDLGLAIARDGTWSYRGSPVRREGLVKLFASVLHRTTDGRYWLVTPGELGTIDVADVPFVAVEMQIDGDGPSQAIALRTNLGDWVTVGADHPLRLRAQPDGSSAPYVTVRDALEARLDRAVYYDLVDVAVAVDQRFGVWSGGVFFPLETEADMVATASARP
ncbi:MAG: DUF1285 domain-containing protein [Pseudomonadota bacterium]